MTALEPRDRPTANGLILNFSPVQERKIGYCRPCYFDDDCQSELSSGIDTNKRTSIEDFGTIQAVNDAPIISPRNLSARISYDASQASRN